MTLKNILAKFVFPRKCIICAELHIRGMVCSNGHLICKSCTQSYVISYDSGPLLCPMNNIHMNEQRCISDSYRLSKVKKYSDFYWDDFYEKYKLSMNTSVVYDIKKLYMCPQCGYGPVMKTGCDDLLRHHGIPIKDDSYYVYYDNSCRRCYWFSSSIHEWSTWNKCYSED